MRSWITARKGEHFWASTALNQELQEYQHLGITLATHILLAGITMQAIVF